MRTLMKHVWILLLFPSTTAPLPVSSRSLRVEWLTPASQRPSHFKICFDGESSLFTTCPPQFYIWWLLYAVAFPHQFDSYYFDALGNSRTIVIWCMSPSQLTPQFYRGRGYIISYCCPHGALSANLSKYWLLPLDPSFTSPLRNSVRWLFWMLF